MTWGYARATRDLAADTRRLAQETSREVKAAEGRWTAQTGPRIFWMKAEAWVDFERPDQAKRGVHGRVIAHNFGVAAYVDGIEALPLGQVASQLPDARVSNPGTEMRVGFFVPASPGATVATEFGFKLTARSLMSGVAWETTCRVTIEGAAEVHGLRSRLRADPLPPTVP